MAPCAFRGAALASRGVCGIAVEKLGLILDFDPSIRGRKKDNFHAPARNHGSNDGRLLFFIFLFP